MKEYSKIPCVTHKPKEHVFYNSNGKIVVDICVVCGNVLNNE